MNDLCISDMGPTGDDDYGAFNPAVAYNSAGTGEYLVVWHGDDNTGILMNDEDEIYAQRFAPVVGDLELSKTVDTPTPALGDVVTFTLTISNTGPDSVMVEDLLPAGLTYVSYVLTVDFHDSWWLAEPSLLVSAHEKTRYMSPL
jgi:uncharacterized repeat protein (TIGR01451 family)